MKLMQHWRRLFGRPPSAEVAAFGERAALAPSLFATHREARMWLRTPFLPVARGRLDPSFMDTEPGVGASEIRS